MTVTEVISAQRVRISITVRRERIIFNTGSKRRLGDNSDKEEESERANS